MTAQKKSNFSSSSDDSSSFIDSSDLSFSDLIYSSIEDYSISTGSLSSQPPSHRFDNEKSDSNSSDNLCFSDSLNFEPPSPKSNSFYSTNSEEPSLSYSLDQYSIVNTDDIDSTSGQSRESSSTFLHENDSALSGFSSSSDQFKNIFSRQMPLQDASSQTHLNKFSAPSLNSFSHPKFHEIPKDREYYQTTPNEDFIRV
jgi:hypothetical protein